MSNTPKIYQLYHDKEHAVLKVAPLQSIFYNTSLDKMLDINTPNVIVRYNEFYFFSFSRKSLVELARKMKDEWVQELEMKLATYNSIKI